MGCNLNRADSTSADLRGAVVSGQDLAASSRTLATALGIVIDGD
ncbi:MAG TPA: hypothetical protein VF163_05210 [Micromonosporaceae bacterium]